VGLIDLGPITANWVVLHDAAERPDMNRPSILLVDDDDDLSEALVDVLTSAGFRVSRAADGAEGLAHLGQEPPPDLILLDWNMPVMGGSEMFAAMQRRVSWADLPIVLLTGHGDAKRKALALRAAGYLTKPIDSADLIRMVSALIREHAALRSRRGTRAKEPIGVRRGAGSRG
jgi:two-component system chemotaxis response regulator CheY